MIQEAHFGPLLEVLAGINAATNNDSAKNAIVDNRFSLSDFGKQFGIPALRSSRKVSFESMCLYIITQFLNLWHQFCKERGKKLLLKSLLYYIRVGGRAFKDIFHVFSIDVI